MEKAIEQLQDSARELDKMAAGTNIALVEMRTQFETLAEMQKEERIEMQKMYSEIIEKMEDKHAKDIKNWKHVVISMVLVLALFIGGVIGTVAYFMVNFDVQFGYVQDAYIGGDGTNNINDGLHISGE